MRAFKEQVKGAGQQAKGTVKEAAGKATGNRRMEVEGKIDKSVGKVRQAVARPAEAMKGAAREAKGTLKRELGEATRDADLAAEGEGEMVEGRIRRKMNE